MSPAAAGPSPAASPVDTDLSSVLCDPEFFAEHRLPAHSDHRWYASAAEAAAAQAAGSPAGSGSYETCLNGVWKFHYAPAPSQTLPGFQAPDFDVSGWDDIRVPAHIQMAGYDRPQYVNTQYPWDGREALAIGDAPTRFNPVGSYVTWFDVTAAPTGGERLVLSFKGAESALAVWVNGVYVGYATDSFTPSDFDITDVVVPGSNRLACQVVKWCAQSWMEDQDFYRFSGLFRDVVLQTQPVAHARDIHVVTDVAADLSSAAIRVIVALSGPAVVRDEGAAAGAAEARALAQVAVALDGVGDFAPDPDRPVTTDPATGDVLVTLCAAVPDPRLWSPEDPHLYQGAVRVSDAAGSLTEHIPLEVGVRRFGVEDGLLRLNGRRVVFRGVNRHEFGLDGRVMTREQTEADLRLIRRAGMNAIRTSHYPNNSFLYELCDRYGVMVVDESNMESHGLWDQLMREGRPFDQATPGDRPEWRAMLMDRAESMLRRDRNHASVVMWSCGNESLVGTDILAVADWFRSVDDRPVHYEGTAHDDRFPQTTDVWSRMYASAADCEAFLAAHPDKPFILCEYAHAMGNSFGAVDRYMDLAQREPRFQGAFIWDFADQAIRLSDRYGRAFLGYGGDCGEAPHDGDFCGNGILFADHSPSPKMQEVAHVYRPVATAVDAPAGRMTVTNHLLVTATSELECVATLSREGRELAQTVVSTDVAPGRAASYDLPAAVRVPSGAPEPGAPASAPRGEGRPWSEEYAIDVSWRLRAETIWAPAGFEVAHDQGVARVRAPEATGPGTVRAGAPSSRIRGTEPAPELIDGIHNIGVRGRHFEALFSKIHGGMTSYRFGRTRDGGRELLRGAPMPNFWHAPTSNERGWGMGAEDGQWLLASRYATAEAGGPDVGVGDDGAVTVTYTYDLPTSPRQRARLAYRVDGEGRIEVALAMRPGAGLPDMPEFGVLMAADADLHRLTWYGEGPEESSADRRGGARLGLWSGEVADQLTPYLRPQEAGNHTGVRWAALTDDRGAGLRLEFAGGTPGVGAGRRAEDGWSGGGMELSVLPWTPFEIENAQHAHELPAPVRTILRPALMRRGVGGDDSWGARTHPEYLLPTAEQLGERGAAGDGELVFRFSFQGML